MLLKSTSSAARYSGRGARRGATIALSAVAAVLSNAGPARASTCCAGSGGQSVCVLGEEQAWQFGASMQAREALGQFDPYGERAALGSGTTLRTVTTTLGAAVRLGEDWAASLSVPVVGVRVKQGGRKGVSTQVGDPVVEARYLLWEDLAFLPARPGLSFLAGARAPIGTSVFESQSAVGGDVSGEGFWVAHTGFAASKLYRPLRFGVDGTVFFPFARAVERMRGNPVAQAFRLRTGTRFQLSESVTWLLGTRWSAAVGLRQFWQLGSEMDGALVAASATRLFTSMLSLGFQVTDAWALGAAYETVFPWGPFGANQYDSHAGTVSVTYGVF